MRKILTVIGARPQFIKAAPVSKALSEYSQLGEVLVHTGQHYDNGMSEIFFKELQISQPQHNLGVGSGSHAVQTGEIMKRLEEVLVKEEPDMVLIYGDTNSTLAGALTAAKLHIPVAHVEAGMRSFNRKMAEEINRIVADRLSSLLFAPTQTAVENLRKEGMTEGVRKTGDVMYDVALQYSEKTDRESTVLHELDLRPKEYILTTVHRAENTDDRSRLSNIFTALSRICRQTSVVLPIHPRTRKMLCKFGLEHLLEKITVIEPVGFLDMMCLESNAKLIVTDSGGIQKEAYFRRVPCVTLRDETEWVETVEAGWNRLAEADRVVAIIDAIEDSLTGGAEQRPISEYGDGDASRRIVSAVREFFGLGLGRPRVETAAAGHFNQVGTRWS